MGKAKKVIMPLFIVLAVALIINFLSATDEGADFTSFTTGERGTSLLFDIFTLMEHDVRVSYRPLGATTDLSSVYFIIQPTAPAVTEAMAREMLDWVRRGGRLLFLHNQFPTIIDMLIDEEYGHDLGDLVLFRYGYGEVATGPSYRVTNGHILHSTGTAHLISLILERWEAETIFFAEYYHGVLIRETLLGRMPVIIRLLFVQMALAGVVIVWHLGKRFGNPIPFYEETEREENEYVRALARLYFHTRKSRRKSENRKEYQE